MKRTTLTGERLSEEDPLYGADLARHRSAYQFARTWAAGGRVLDLGSGTGYGAEELAESAGFVLGLDRVPPSTRARRSAARFVRGDLATLPLAPGSFDLVVSCQVIEHLRDPTPYLRAIAEQLSPRGTALLTTPNLLQSDRENPFHVHEYEPAELETVLRRQFGQVEMRGIHAVGPAARFHEERLRRIRRITRLDPLGLRRRLPRGLVEWAFARLSRFVRLAIRRGDPAPEVDVAHFPLGPADERCLDLLAVCREPRRGSR